MSVPTTSEDTDSATSSPGLAGGPSPSGSPAGETAGPPGRDPAPASPSPTPVPGGVSPTSGTCGPRGSSSSGPVDPRSSLGSRLRALMALGGSTLFRTTWRERATPSGRPICALRASVPRTSGRGSTSSPTFPAGWSTPSATEYGNTLENYRAMKANMTSGPRTAITHLCLQAQLAPWTTPTSTDSQGHAGQGEDVRTGSHHTGRSLATQAHGTIPSGSPAPTAERGRLNPAFVRWLMGFPREWDACAPTATPSSPRSRRGSLAFLLRK